MMKKLEDLAGKDLLSGADELLRSVKKSPKPKKKRRYPCQFCRGVCASLANLHKHVASFHIPGNKQKKSNDYICINCSQSFRYNASLRRHAKSCAAMFRVDSDIDIAEDEPMPDFGTGHTVKIELDKATTVSNNASDPRSDTGDSATLAGGSAAHAQDCGAKDGQGHLNSQLTLEDYENIIGSVKPSHTQLTSVFTQPESPNGMTNKIKVETDQSAHLVEPFRHPISNTYRTENSDREARHRFELDNHPTQEPVVLEEPLKRIQLHRKQPPVPVGVDEGPNYGLPDDNPAIAEGTDLRITSVTGGCIETRNTIFAEAEKGDTENIDI